MFWKIGDVAQQTGLTVRTLHYYEEIGLLAVERTVSGHRLYDEAALQRLLQIVALKQMGLSLEQVAACLERPAQQLLVTLEHHLAVLDQEIARQLVLRQQLERVIERLRQEPTLPGTLLLQTLEHLVMVDSYYTSEQLEQLKQRREALGEDGMQAATQAWEEIFAQAEAAMRKGLSPENPEVEALRQRAQEMVAQFTGGDPGIRQGLQQVWEHEGDALSQRFGYKPEVMAFLWQRGK